MRECLITQGADKVLGLIGATKRHDPVRLQRRGDRSRRPTSLPRGRLGVLPRAMDVPHRPYCVASVGVRLAELSLRRPTWSGELDTARSNETERKTYVSLLCWIRSASCRFVEISQVSAAIKQAECGKSAAYPVGRQWNGCMQALTV